MKTKCEITINKNINKLNSNILINHESITINKNINELNSNR